MKHFDLIQSKIPSVTNVQDVNAVVLATITQTRNTRNRERFLVRLVDIPYICEVQNEDEALKKVGALLDSLPEPVKQ